MSLDPTRCTTHYLDLEDAGRAASDPALALLMNAGWTVISDVPITGSKEKAAQVLLFLAPPRSGWRAYVGSWVVLGGAMVAGMVLCLATLQIGGML